MSYCWTVHRSICLTFRSLSKHFKSLSTVHEHCKQVCCINCGLQTNFEPNHNCYFYQKGSWEPCFMISFLSALIHSKQEQKWTNVCLTLKVKVWWCFQENCCTKRLQAASVWAMINPPSFSLSGLQYVQPYTKIHFLFAHWRIEPKYEYWCCTVSLNTFQP